MIYRKKSLQSVLFFIVLICSFFTGCLSTQPKGNSIATATPGVSLTTATIPPLIVERTITPTNSPTSQATNLSPSSSNTITAVVSPTPTKPIPATDTPQPVEPLPISWIALEDITVSIDVIQTNGMGRRSIVEDVHYPSNPKWSPDGQWIAFIGANSSNSFDSQIFLVRPDGSELKQLTFTQGYKNTLSWSPDGQSLVYSQVNKSDIGDGRSNESEVELYVYSFNSSQIRQITDTQGIYEHNPVFSPSEDAIAFLSIEQDGQPYFFELMLLELGTNITRQLIETPLDIGSFAWSPDGSQITFVSSGSEADPYACNEIYVVNSDGSGLRQLTSSNEVHYSSLSWYPSGKWIVFEKAECHYPAAPGFTDLYVMQLGKDEAILIPGTQKTWSPAWSPWPAIQTGQRLFITKLGANLQLRLTPSLSGEAIKTLKEGDAISVLEGPIEADDYLWWRVSVNNGEGEGWIAENPGWFSSD